MTVELKNDTVTVKEADIDKVLEAGEVGTITIDVSSLDENVSEIVIPGEMLDKIARAAADEANDADGLEIKLPGGTISLNADALEAISRQSKGNDLRLNLDGIEEDNLNAPQRQAISEKQVEAVYDAFMTAGFVLKALTERSIGDRLTVRSINNRPTRRGKCGREKTWRRGGEIRGAHMGKRTDKLHGAGAALRKGA